MRDEPGEFSSGLSLSPVPWGMQNQQEREPTRRPKRRRSRRSVGELLAAWVLVVGGAGVSVPVYIVAVSIIRQYPSLVEVALFAPWMVSVLLCCCGGLASLLRHRNFSRWLLTGAAFLLLVSSGIWLYWFRHTGNMGFGVVYCLGIITIAAFLFFLGRWLGRQEDIDTTT